ncbi:hypothetical protein AB0I22_27800 [Streptomyces sp. NPDC050610]|uniref:hypothetical protein n=1 Tax=Streptomyces sp. NPDC050610 TaxID=3157097 RepID=UPI00342CEB7D
MSAGDGGGGKGRTATADRDQAVHRIPGILGQSATDAALVSGAFSPPGHVQLIALPHRWRDAVHDFNRWLDLAGLRTYVSQIPDEELLAIDSSTHRPGGRLDKVPELRTAVESLLRERCCGSATAASRASRPGSGRSRPRPTASDQLALWRLLLCRLFFYRLFFYRLSLRRYGLGLRR